jgi:methionine synthase I (cobalamin-dependent)
MRSPVLYRSFVEAGADVILTNTFGANAPRLKLHKAEDPGLRDQQAGAQLARAVATSPAGRSSLPARWDRPATLHAARRNDR